MQTVIPKTTVALSSLLRADFTTQWRNRRAAILTLLVPVIILMTWKGVIQNGPLILANSITIGVFASGIMGYANTIARDRDKGIFERLRVAPIPSWSIMVSRLLVQIAMFLLIVTVIFVIGKQYDGITLTPLAYTITYFTSILGGAVSLSLGQTMVGLIKNPETVNSTTRLVYLALILMGIFGQVGQSGDLGDFGNLMSKAVQWSPYGTIKTMLAASMEPEKWTGNTSFALLVTILYTLVFTTLGVKWFKWNTK